ncbi:Alpha/Beta hydrolase protein [Echria macrotheca]|uniref:Carboxylic ester hydrolase n=1 Tax=Echria macrotheca TaxID=438768 RepID=A0AAJ0BEV0_9PEZI|nr:Alpha/Beta hydrolase protein [Echria macrotheca]
MKFRSSISQAFMVLALSDATLGLPVVDLLTSVHQGSLEGNGTFYGFNNVPYAEPPLGELRFRVPIPKISINRTVNDGSTTRICPQASGAWFGLSVPFLFETLTGQPPPSGPAPPSGPDPRESEDCLYLNVKSPRKVFDNNLSNLPVLVWIHGGGFTMGYKDQFDPTGLMAQGMSNGKNGFVYVGINYRLGLFGFPPKGPSFRDWDVATNAGLYDQRLALLWVQKNIHKFGGNPNQVTVMGESAGGSSIAAQLTAFYGIDGEAPFNRAVIQSPAIRPATDATVYAGVYQQFSSAAGVSSMDQARDLTTTQLQSLNSAIVANSSFGHFTFGPNVDGLFFPDELVRSLSSRRVDSSVDVIVAYNLNEGLLFTDPRVTDNTGFKNYFAGLMPSIPASKINQLATTVYPEDFSGAQPYTTQIQRLVLAVAESLIHCNAFATDLGYNNQTRSYKFSVWPGVHSADTSYTFYNGQPVDNFGFPINATIAQHFQKWWVDYTTLGEGSGSSITEIPIYTSQAKILNITDTGNFVVRDPAAGARCRFWIDGLYN